MDSVFQKPLDDDIQDVAEGMAIVINGDTAPQAISSGQYLFIKNHSTLATGGYHATAAITSGGSVTSSNVAADANGIVNAAYSSLNGNIATKQKTIYSVVTYKESESVNGNATGSVSITAPSGASSILAIIPFAPSAMSSWNTYAIVTSVSISGTSGSIGFRTFGATAQKYACYYQLLYTM